MRHITISWLALALACALSCASSHGPGDPARDAGRTDAGRRVPPVADASAPPVLDASARDGCALAPFARGPELRLTEEEAVCMGLADPVCVGCHSTGDDWFLRPSWAPPPPADVGMSGPSLEECLDPCVGP